MPRERVNLKGLGPIAQHDTPAPEPAPASIAASPEGDLQAPRSYETPQFRFVPVGLSPANLAWIEGVIAVLKRKGNRQASRSKIIRALIERYGRRLERDLFGPDAHTPISPSDHGT